MTLRRCIEVNERAIQEIGRRDARLANSWVLHVPVRTSGTFEQSTKGQVPDVAESSNRAFERGQSIISMCSVFSRSRTITAEAHVPRSVPSSPEKRSMSCVT